MLDTSKNHRPARVNIPQDNVLFLVDLTRRFPDLAYDRRQGIALPEAVRRATSCERRSGATEGMTHGEHRQAGPWTRSGFHDRRGCTGEHADLRGSRHRRGARKPEDPGLAHLP